jgi:hypothetical protein
MQKNWQLTPMLATLLFGTLLSTSCLGPGGDTTAEKRASALEMRDEALAALYEDKPSLKEKVEKSAGYAVFSNFSVHPGLLSFASGYGVLTNKATDEVTHQRWLRLTIGPGIAVKGLYAVAIFDDAATVERFEKGPWVAGGQLELGFVFGDFGGSFEKGWAFRRGVGVHYTTHTGVALEIELFGIGKVSNTKLNKTDPP